MAGVTELIERCQQDKHSQGIYDGMRFCKEGLVFDIDGKNLCPYFCKDVLLEINGKDYHICNLKEGS